MLVNEPADCKTVQLVSEFTRLYTAYRPWLGCNPEEVALSAFAIAQHVEHGYVMGSRASSYTGGIYCS